MMTNEQHEQALAAAMQSNAMLRSQLDELQSKQPALASECDALRTQYLSLAELVNGLVAERRELHQKISELEAANKKLTDMLWGRRSERRSDGSATPLLDFGDSLQDTPEPLPADIITAQAAAQAAIDQAKLAELEARRQARKARREAQGSREELPAHLERRERVLDLREDQKVGLKLFSKKITERLRFEKPSVYVERIIRYEYVPEVPTTAGQSPIVAAAPLPSIVEGCKYDFSVIAAVATMKFGFHMPTYRQEDFFGQSGWRPSRSTINDLINYAVDCIAPLYDQMEACVMNQPICLGDATELTVLLRDSLSEEDQQVLAARQKNRHQQLKAKQTSKASTQTGSARSFAWLYSGLDAPPEWQTDLQVPPPERPPPNFDEARWSYAPYNIFHWSLTQKNSVIDSHLARFRGTFVGDAAGVNADLAARSGGRIAHQSCVAHARRYFVKAESNDPVLASQMTALFRELYAIEYRGRELSVAERLELRQREAVSVWQRIKQWLDSDTVRGLLPKSEIGKAVGYLRNQWESLQRYLRDGSLPLDNNHSERVIRPLTIGRKNWMFLGSVAAAPSRMRLFSIVSSAQRHGLSIQDYLSDIFLQLSQAAQNRPQELELGSPFLMSLLPDRWGASHACYVHHDRLASRKQAAEDKLYYRLQAGLAGNHPYAAVSSLS